MNGLYRALLRKPDALLYIALSFLSYEYWTMLNKLNLPTLLYFELNIIDLINTECFISFGICFLQMEFSFVSFIIIIYLKKNQNHEQ